MQQFFQDFPTWLLLLSILVTILVLAFSADKMVDGAAALARHTGLSELVIGVTIISLGTTMPEMVVSVFAAFYGSGDLALGNAVGSIIADTALIMGLLIFLSKVQIERRSSMGTLWWRDLSATALVVAAQLLPEHILPRWMGLVFLALLAVFLFYTYWNQVKGPKKSLQAQGVVDDKAGKQGVLEHSELSLAKCMTFLLLGLLFMVGSSRMLLPQINLFALRIGVAQDIIATTLVAFGTSLPELTTTIAAIRKKKGALGIGNIMGADILNALFVVGAAVLTHPIQVEPIFFRFHFWAMLVVLWSLRLTLIGQHRKGQWHIPRWYGLCLILSYVAYITLQYTQGVERLH